jgi:RNA polymerase sigma-70 factor (ECF subfamily)
MRPELADEAIRLARILRRLLPSQREVAGLLALMLLVDARRATRTDEAGELVLLEDQDRSMWERAQIEEGRSLVVPALTGGPPGPYALQAAIAAVHDEAATVETTDWVQIVGLYDVLRVRAPSPVIELNRAVAIAMVSGPVAGLRLIDDLAGSGLDQYHLLHAARGRLLDQLGRYREAAGAYRTALEFVGNEPERAFLTRCLTTAEERAMA